MKALQGATGSGGTMPLSISDQPGGFDTGAGGRGMARLEGVAVSPGVGIGTVHVHDSALLPVPEYRVPSGLIERERLRLTEAAERAIGELRALGQRMRSLEDGPGEELATILEAYEGMLRGSRLLRGVDARIRERHINAEAAVRQETTALIGAFAAMEDAYLAARIDDIREVGRRLIRNLSGQPRPSGLTGLKKGGVIVAEDLSPADTALLNPRQMGGFVTVLGASQSHTAIMARSLGLPAVVAIPDLLRHARAGDSVIVDGTEGLVVINPDPDTLAAYRQRRATFLRARRNLQRLRDVPSVTRDGVAIHLHANIELPGEVESVAQSGAEGIGLVRSEFLFMNRDSLPDEAEQCAAYAALVRHMGGRPVTIRTLDLGGDKLSQAVGLKQPTNPALGLRAIRLSLRRIDLLRTQFAAILAAGCEGPVRILLPMVCTVDEVHQSRALLSEVAEARRAAGQPVPDPLPPLGVMIEVPAAALSADALARAADFFSIGTNDLTQYALAIDRTDEAVAPLYNPLHPAVLRLIHFATGAAQATGIPVSVCGEIAGDPRLTGLLYGLGVRELSMAALAIPTVKQQVRRLSGAAALAHAHRVLGQPDAQRINALVDAFNQTT
jgi:phosphotransferase system enzyme I (PtsI)